MTHPLADMLAIAARRDRDAAEQAATAMDPAEAKAHAEAVLRAYLKEAMSYAEAGITPPKAKSDINLPPELIDALDADLQLAEAFHSLTPGRQKSYVINLTSTKVPATRIARIEKFRAKILAGKGATDR